MQKKDWDIFYKLGGVISCLCCCWVFCFRPLSLGMYQTIFISKYEHIVSGIVILESCKGDLRVYPV